MNLKNHKKEEITLDITKLNLYSLPFLLGIIILFGAPYYFIWHPIFSFEAVRNYLRTAGPWAGVLIPLIIIAVLTLGLAFHELIHGLTWARYTEKGFKAISFGVLWKYLTPYCHCNEPMIRAHFVIGAMMPTVILGFLPTIIAFLIENTWLFAFGLIFIASGIGDLMLTFTLLKEEQNTLIEDHPTKVGYYVYRIKKNN